MKIGCYIGVVVSDRPMTKGNKNDDTNKSANEKTKEYK
jgi:hypothetical protein